MVTYCLPCIIWKLHTVDAIFRVDLGYALVVWALVEIK